MLHIFGIFGDIIHISMRYISMNLKSILILEKSNDKITIKL